MQGHTRNPFADPGLLGVEAGASCAVVVAIYSLGIDDLAGYAWFALAGAGIAAAAVFAIGTSRGGPDPVSLVLAGAAVSALLARGDPGHRGPRRGDPRRLPLLGGRVGVRPRAVGVLGGAPVPRGRAPVRRDEHSRAQPAPARRRRGGLAGAEPVAAEGARHRGRDAADRRRDRRLRAGRRSSASSYRTWPDGSAGWTTGGWSPTPGCWAACCVIVADIVGRLVVRPAELQVGIVMALIGEQAFVVLVRRMRMVRI